MWGLLQKPLHNCNFSTLHFQLFYNQLNARCPMFEDINPVSSLLEEIRGNTNFLERLIFPNIKVILFVIGFGALIAVTILF